MDLVAKRSYLGVASCVLFSIATAMILAVAAANWNAHHKLAGYEMIIVGPFALLLYVSGIGFALAGRRKPAENPLSNAGLVLNSVPLILLLFRGFHSAAGG
jgi:hypothetical protein